MAHSVGHSDAPCQRQNVGWSGTVPGDLVHCVSMPVAAKSPGQRIRALRKRTPRLSADTVADAVGLSRTHLSMIENGHDLPGRETLAALAAYFNVSIDYILNGSDAAPKPPDPNKVVDDPDELALLNFWRTLNDAEKRLMLKMLGAPPAD